LKNEKWKKSGLRTSKILKIFAPAAQKMEVICHMDLQKLKIFACGAKKEVFGEI